MPDLTLSNDELRDADQAVRAAAHRAQKHAPAQGSPRSALELRPMQDAISC
jgi:hypothetical protein